MKFYFIYLLSIELTQGRIQDFFQGVATFWRDMFGGNFYTVHEAREFFYALPLDLPTF